MEAAEGVAVIGAGSWGTALTRPLADNGLDITLWAHRPEFVDQLCRERENKTYLPGYSFADTIKPLSDIGEAVVGRRLVVMVVPSHVYRSVFQRIVPFLAPGAHIISATKGIENESLFTMTQVMEEELAGHGGPYHLGVLSGPSFAKEVALGIPTLVTVASRNREAAQFFQEAFSTEKFRAYASNDVIGLEIGGALKNIVAIAAGICDGLRYGTNTRAALITRGLAEISRLGVKMGAHPLTFSGLGGLGDLVLTCTGDLSRNRTVGLKLGQGKTLDVILGEMNMVAEGIKTTRSAWNLARREGVEMPILEQIHAVLYDDKPCTDAVRDLLRRDLREERG